MGIYERKIFKKKKHAFDQEKCKIQEKRKKTRFRPKESKIQEKNTLLTFEEQKGRCVKKKKTRFRPRKKGKKHAFNQEKIRFDQE